MALGKLWLRGEELRHELWPSVLRTWTRTSSTFTVSISLAYPSFPPTCQTHVPQIISPRYLHGRPDERRTRAHNVLPAPVGSPATHPRHASAPYIPQQ